MEIIKRNGKIILDITIPLNGVFRVDVKSKHRKSRSTKQNWSLEKTFLVLPYLNTKELICIGMCYPGHDNCYITETLEDIIKFIVRTCSPPRIIK